MARLLSLFAMLSVLLLVGAAVPSSKSFGKTIATSDQGRDTATVTSSTVPPTPTPTPKAPIDDAAAVLAKLKPKPEIASSSRREAPVQLPKQIVIPAIAVDAGFEFVGLTQDGAMDVPKDPTKVAWYRLGPRPGEIGNAIIAGHVDWGGKTAVFWGLNELKPGDLIEVVSADGKKYQFIVQWQRWFDADKAPVEQLFAQSDVAELTMITCGGVFDRSKRQYLSRLVVRAVLR